MFKTPITPQIINDALINKIAAAMNVDISGLTTQELQTGIIQELGSMQTYTLESMNTEKLAKAFYKVYRNLSNDPQYYSKPSPETGHPLKGMQGTQFDTTFEPDPAANWNLDPQGSVIMAPDFVKEITEHVFSKLMFEGKKYLNMEEFKKLPNDLNTQNNWLEEHGTKLGLGSARGVFLIDSSKVLKAAFDEKGIEQNKMETKVFKDKNFSDILVPIFEVGPNYHWIVTELVRPLKSLHEWQDLTGVSWQKLRDAMEDIRWQDTRKDYPEPIQTIVKLSLKYKLLAGDLERIENWGKTSDGRAVILDYGFDAKTRDRHYKN